MRVGFYQSDVKAGDRRHNLDRAAAALGSSAFDLVVLTELFATGYMAAAKTNLAAVAEAVPAGPTTAALVDIARMKQAFIVGSLAEADGAHLYNTAVVAGPHGFVGKHRKVHLPALERRFFDPGGDGGLFDLGGVRIGIVICFESWLPERCRRLALDGADILCHPANYGGTMTPDVIRTRAIENMVFTITANRIGREKMDNCVEEFRGESRIVDPAGTILLQAERAETLGLVEIDPLRARRKSSGVCVDLLAEIARAGEMPGSRE